MSHVDDTTITDLILQCGQQPWLPVLLTHLHKDSGAREVHLFRRDDVGFHHLAAHSGGDVEPLTLLSGFDFKHTHLDLDRLRRKDTVVRRRNRFFPVHHRGHVQGGLVLLLDEGQGDPTWTPPPAIMTLLAAENHRLCLEHEIARRTEEPDYLAKRLFIANISHEIKTPLHGIIGYFQLLEQTKLTARQKLCVHQMQNSCTVLLRVINNVLDLARLSSNKVDVHRECVLLKDVIQEVRQGCAHQMEQRLQRLVLPTWLPCRWVGFDRGKVCQILINLLTNASKFTPPQSQVELTVRLESAQPPAPAVSLTPPPRPSSSTLIREPFSFVAVPLPEDTKGPLLVFDVIDQGTGVLREDADRIFDVFTRTQQANHIAGTGLGLAICKKLALLLKAGLSLRTGGTGGTTFTFQVPFVPYEDEELQGEDQTEETSEGLARLKGRRVLHVDDVFTNRVAMGTLLWRWGVHCVQCSSGEEALGFLADPSYNFDAALLDICMPQMTGIELAKQVRLSFPTLPLIALSSLQGFVPSGSFNHVLTKPFRNLHLYRVLVDLFRDPMETGGSVQAMSLTAPSVVFGEADAVSLESPQGPKGGGEEKKTQKKMMSTLVKKKKKKKKKKHKRSNPAETEETTRLRARRAAVRLLVVEDSDPNRLLLVEMLRCLGYTCIETATDGDEAIRILDQRDFDLMLLDLRMPRVNGYGVLKHLDEIKKPTTCVTVAITASSLERDRILCQEAGVAWYLTKPVTLKHLESVLADALGF